MEFEGTSIWHTKGGTYSLACGGDIRILEELLYSGGPAAVADSGAKAAQLGRVDAAHNCLLLILKLRSKLEPGCDYAHVCVPVLRG